MNWIKIVVACLWGFGIIALSALQVNAQDDTSQEVISLVMSLMDMMEDLNWKMDSLEAQLESQHEMLNTIMSGLFPSGIPPSTTHPGNGTATNSSDPQIDIDHNSTTPCLNDTTLNETTTTDPFINETNTTLLINETTTTESSNETSTSTESLSPCNCRDIYESGQYTSGSYVIIMNGEEKNVYCDMDTDGGGWMVFQRREDGSVDFARSWVEYQQGFGNVSGEHWLGNQAIYEITSRMDYNLRIDLEDFRGRKIYAKYELFHIGSPEDRYRLFLEGFIGNATDALSDADLGGASLNGMEFTTWDTDNDNSPAANCANQYGGQGGWWYNYCFFANVNGIYRQDRANEGWDGIVWYTWSKKRPLRWTEMKIRPADFDD